MILLAFLLFLARSSGFPTSPETAIPTPTHSSNAPLMHHQILRRAPWDHPNPETGLCDCPDTRSIVEILWTCASTLILATWVSVHLNIPPKGASGFRSVVLRFGAMLTTILAPEATLQWAIIEWRQARQLTKKITELRVKNGKKQCACKSLSFESTQANTSIDPEWTMTHSFYVVMGGFALKDGAILRPVEPTEFPDKVGREFAFPTISEEEIKDKSKGDGLTKTLAIFQLLWFSVQLIGRLAKGWAATELEVLTFATCLMTLAIYFLWWNKGLDIRCQTVLDPIHETKVDVEVADSLEPEEVQEYGAFRELQVVVISSRCVSEPKKKPTFFTSHPKPQHRFHVEVFENKMGFKPLLKIILFPFMFIVETIGNLDMVNWGPDCANPVSPYGLDHTRNLVWEIYVPFLSASLFGAMHFITWSFTMLTLAELWMWRIASIALTALPIIAIISILVVATGPDDEKPTGWRRYLLFIVSLCCMIPHPVVRLIVAVDSVALLRNLPDTAFLVLSWSNVIPSL